MLSRGRYLSHQYVFVKTINEGTTEKELEFVRAREAVREYVKMAFGVLVARFHILKSPEHLRDGCHIAMVI